MIRFNLPGRRCSERPRIRFSLCKSTRLNLVERALKHLRLQLQNFVCFSRKAKMHKILLEPNHQSNNILVIYSLVGQKIIKRESSMGYPVPQVWYQKNKGWDSLHWLHRHRYLDIMSSTYQNGN